MKILITGSEGFIGKHLTEYLNSRGYSVIRVDKAQTAEIRIDLTEPEAVFNRLGEYSFDAVVHLAAIADIPATLKDPYTCYRVNCFGTLNMLELAARKSVSRFIYLSSANYYGAPDKVPVSEEDPPNPRTPYDYSKVVGEKLVDSYHKHKGLPTAILRPWKTFGEYEQENKVVPRFIKACLMGEPIPLYNEGRDATDPYHVENLCYAIELCLTKEAAIGKAYNVGTGNRITIRELAETIKRLTNSTSTLQPLPPRTKEEEKPQVSIPSIQKITKELNYQPKLTLEQGLNRVIQHIKTKTFKKNQNKQL
ncbi:MAG: NAD-dependent epimerase/dehydratase family protein [Aigarchaeota archaeon]|nr:NAD-dependent epimerase/dehydratase family protein [Candidatus Pelearchaeum maunauluense]